MDKRTVWAVCLDLDETLVLTSSLEPLRKARKWQLVYAEFSKTSLPNGTLEFIAKLKCDTNARLAVVTKAPRPYAEKLLAHHRIEIPVEVAYHDVAKVKPDPEALLLASQKLGIPPRQCIYVGDDAADVKAARSAGFTPIGVCWGEKRDIGLGSVCSSWMEVYDQIVQVVSR